jgi:hypothetical protein
VTAAIRPVTREGLAEHLIALAGDLPARARIAIDGAPPTEPDALAEAVADGLRILGRAAIAVRAADFLRPASVRLEYGHQDEDMFLDGWLDTGALRREVLDPAAADGRVLPRLWDTATDRAYRADYRELTEPSAVLVSGSMLLGRGLPFELTAHLHMGRTALARRTPAEERWTLPVYERYDRERRPADEADVLVMADHPERPAIRS